MAKLCKREDYQRPKPDMTPPESGVWYAVITRPNCEHKAAEKLRSVCRAYVPVTSQVVRGGGPKGGERVSERALFPRYVFVSKIGKGMFPFFALRGCDVESIVRGGDNYPFAIAHEVVAAVMERQEAGEWDESAQVKMKRTLEDHGLYAGQLMRIRSGAMEGLLVKIEGLARGGQDARCLHDMLGREIKAQIPLAELEKVA